MSRRSFAPPWCTYRIQVATYTKELSQNRAKAPLKYYGYIWVNIPCKMDNRTLLQLDGIFFEIRIPMAYYAMWVSDQAIFVQQGKMSNHRRQRHCLVFQYISVIFDIFKFCSIALFILNSSQLTVCSQMQLKCVTKANWILVEFYQNRLFYQMLLSFSWWLAKKANITAMGWICHVINPGT